MNRTWKFLAPISLTIIVLGIGYAGVKLLATTEKPLPNEQKLADISNDHVVTDIIWPNAEEDSYQLVVGIQKFLHTDDQACPDFSATVTITDTDGSTVEEFDLSPENSQRCNWLEHDHGLDGYILTWKQRSVLQSCTAGEKYKLELTFEKRPKEFQSLWLSYLQSEEQKNNSEKTKPDQAVAP